MERIPAVYIITNRRNGTLYTGVTSNLAGRIWQHRKALIDGFSKRYGLKRLVWYEVCDDTYTAITREKQIKGGSRKAKLRLIESVNPGWQDLYHSIL